MRSSAGKAAVLAFLVLSAGCEGNESTAGPSAAPPVVNAPATVDVRVEGRVMDDDRNAPIPDASVRAVAVAADGAQTSVDQPLARAGTDGNGVFFLTASVSPRWTLLLLEVSSNGYEPTRLYLTPATAAAAVLRLYQRLTIRGGESIQMNVRLDSYGCGFESHRCRRVFVHAGEAVDLELIHADGAGKAGLVVGPESHHPFSVSVTDYQPRATVSGGEVWIFVAQWGSVTLTASRR